MSDPLQRFREAAAVGRSRGCTASSSPYRRRRRAGRPRRQRLPRADPRPAGALRGGGGHPGLGRRGHRLAPGHRHAPRCTPNWKPRWPRSSRRRARWCSPPATWPTSPWSRTLGGPDVLVVSDQGNHASIIDACRLSRSRVAVTPHRDIAASERALAARGEPHAWSSPTRCSASTVISRRYRHCTRFARRYGGATRRGRGAQPRRRGRRGRGAVHAAGLAGEPDVDPHRDALQVARLSGRRGAGRAAEMIGTWSTPRGRSSSTRGWPRPGRRGARRAAHPGDHPGARRRRCAPGRRAGLAGPPGRADHEAADAAVLSVTLGRPACVALHAQQVAAENGVRVGCFRPPSVPTDGACLRLTARANLTEGQLSVAARALHAVARSRAALHR